MYSQLYDACVIPTMLNGAEVFGYINPRNIEKNTKKSIEICIGVHTSTQIQAIIWGGRYNFIFKKLLCMI